MVAMFGLILVLGVLAIIFTRKGKDGMAPAITRMGWLQKLLLIGPIFPFIAIQSGWITAEVGRQPYVVYPSTTGPDGVFMLTNDGISASVSAVEIIITLTLFGLVYLLLLIGWARVVIRFINQGPAPAAKGGRVFGKPVAEEGAVALAANGETAAVTEAAVAEAAADGEGDMVAVEEAVVVTNDAAGAEGGERA